VRANETVIFDIDGDLILVDTEQATTLAENLRLRALGQSGDVPGMEGAEQVADAIEDRLVEAEFGPIPLEGDEAEAVYYLLDSSLENHERSVSRLYRALRKLHRAVEEL
jgi:phosphoglycolate phosphatase-like HAD superfamily hydrolase